MLDGIVADASVLFWVSRAWADHQLCGLLCDEVVEGDFVVAVYGDIGALEDEVLVHVPGEGVVVVDEDNIRGRGYGRGGGRIAGRMVDEA